MPFWWNCLKEKDKDRIIQFYEYSMENSRNFDYSELSFNLRKNFALTQKQVESLPSIISISKLLNDSDAQTMTQNVTIIFEKKMKKQKTSIKLISSKNLTGKFRINTLFEL